MENEGTKLVAFYKVVKGYDKGFIARLRCGLCNRCVIEKTWKEHLESKEHKFRVQELMRIIVDNTNKYGYPDIVKATKDVRKKADAPEVVSFD